MSFALSQLQLLIRRTKIIFVFPVTRPTVLKFAEPRQFFRHDKGNELVFLRERIRVIPSLHVGDTLRSTVSGCGVNPQFKLLIIGTLQECRA